MALPDLPVQGQNPWYVPRNAWDVAVQSRLPDNDAQAVGKGELILNVRDFGATGDGVTIDGPSIQNTLNIAGAIVGLDFGGSLGPRRGATVLIPDGDYRSAVPYTLPGYVTIRGAGERSTRLFNDASDLFAWGDAHGLASYGSIHDIWLSTGNAGGHLFNLDGGLGATFTGIAQFSLVDVQMTTRNATSSIWKQRQRAQLVDITFDRVHMDTTSVRTVPAFDVSVGGNDANSVRFVNCWAHGHGTTAAPFFRVESTGAWNYNWTFNNVVGEQNAGGFIHVYAMDGLVIENCPDWDLLPAYTDDVFKFASVSTRQCKNIRIENSYRVQPAGGAGLTAGKYDINASASTQQNIRIYGCTPPGLSLAAFLNGDVSVDGKTAGFKTVTGTYSLLATDPEEIVCNSASPFNITLPTGLVSLFGRTFRIKNVGAGTVTVVGTVDGAVNPTLAQWAKTAVRTDGQTALFGRIWFTV